MNGTGSPNSTILDRNQTLPFESVSIYDIYHVQLVILLTVVLLVNAFGVLANGVTFLATILYPPLRQSSSRILMAHCILIDFVMSLYGGPTLMLTTYLGRYEWPAWICPVFGATMLANLFATNWAHAILAVNRFVASVLPHHYRWCTRKAVLRCGVAFPWLVVTGMSIFPLGHIGVYYGKTKPWGGCYFFPDPMALSAVGIYGPCTVIGVCYVVVMVRARWALRGRVSLPGKKSPLEKRYEVAKILFGCFIWYCVANYGILLANTVVPHLVGPKTVLGTKGLLYVCSSLNPLIFLLISKDYRAGSVAVLRGRVRRTSGAASNQNKKLVSTTSNTGRISARPISSNKPGSTSS